MRLTSPNIQENNIKRYIKCERISALNLALKYFCQRIIFVKGSFLEISNDRCKTYKFLINYQEKIKGFFGHEITEEKKKKEIKVFSNCMTVYIVFN